MYKIIFIALFVLLTGCQATKNIPTYYIMSDYEHEKGEKVLKKGNNTVTGNSFLRQQGGGIVTCAGFQAYIVHTENYTNERIFAIYGSNVEGYNNSRVLKFVPDLKEYFKNSRRTTCDSSGDFKFNNLVNGEYYIVTQVNWKIGHMIHGGFLMKRIKLKDGELKEVVITK